MTQVRKWTGAPKPRAKRDKKKAALAEIPPQAAPESETTTGPDYSTWKKDDLKAEARALGVSVSGTKADIIERLENA